MFFGCCASGHSRPVALPRAPCSSTRIYRFYPGMAHYFENYIPNSILLCSNGIILLTCAIYSNMQAHESASAQTEAEAWEEERKISKYAEDLEQLPCNRKIPMDPKQVSWSFQRILSLLMSKTDRHIEDGYPRYFCSFKISLCCFVSTLTNICVLGLYCSGNVMRLASQRISGLTFQLGILAQEGR